jgi:hypothetical protein
MDRKEITRLVDRLLQAGGERAFAGSQPPDEAEQTRRDVIELRKRAIDQLERAMTCTCGEA